MQVTITLNSREFEKAIEAGAMQTLAAVMKEMEGGPREIAVSSENKTKREKQVEDKPMKEPVHEIVESEEDPVEETLQEDPEETSVTLEEVRAKLAELSKSGKQAEVKTLITSFGASKLTDVPKENYAELLKAAEGIE